MMSKITEKSSILQLFKRLFVEHLPVIEKKRATFAHKFLSENSNN